MENKVEREGKGLRGKVEDNSSLNLQWFPGHMKKAERLIRENLKIVDVVIELLDARIPLSSQNPMLKEILGEKPRLTVLTKSDLADDVLTSNWIKKFRAENISAVAVDAAHGKGIKNLVAEVKKLAETKTHKLTKYGAKPRSARAMVVGIPNVGKSSLINKLAGMNHAKIENRPGVTRAKQWIKIAEGLDLLDTPGILWPKFEDKEAALKLAWTFAVNDETYDLEISAKLLLETLVKKNPAGLCGRFKLAEPLSEVGEELLQEIGMKRGCIRKGGVLDTEKVIRLVLSEFRSGKLGKITLDDLPS